MSVEEILKQSGDVSYAIGFAMGVLGNYKASSDVPPDSVDEAITALEKANEHHTNIVRDLLNRNEELEQRCDRLGKALTERNGEIHALECELREEECAECHAKTCLGGSGKCAICEMLECNDKKGGGNMEA